MTRREREMTDINEILNILDTCKVVHLGLADGDQPYVVPMNYGYTYENNELIIYMHGAVNGYKYNVMKVNPKVCFEMECDVNPFPGKTACQYGTSYACVMGQGIAELITEPEAKMKALSIFMKTQTGKDFEFNEKLVSIVNVFKVTAKSFTAKKRPIPEGLQ